MAGAFKDLSGQTADSTDQGESTDTPESTDNNTKDEPFVDDPEASSEPAV